MSWSGEEEESSSPDVWWRAIFIAFIIRARLHLTLQGQEMQLGIARMKY